MKPFRRLFNWYLILFSALVLLLILSPIACSKKDSDVIKIGAVLPLTSNIAQFGNYWREGLELALSDAIEKNMLTKGQVQLVIEDGEADPRKSVDAFRKLITADNVIACVGGTSSVTLAMKPIANQHEVVLLNASAISTEIEDAGDYVFSVIPSAYYTGRFLAEAAYQELQKRHAGILYREDQSGESFRKVFSDRFKELGGKIVYEESHPRDAIDYRSYIAKIKSVENMDVIFVASWGTDVAYYVKQAYEMGVGIQVLNYETFYTPKVLEIARNAADGVIFSAPAFDPESEQLKSLRIKLKEIYGHDELNYHVAGHYDAMMLLLTTISEGNRNGKEIQKAISSIHKFKGITGDIVFDNNGEGSIPLMLYTVKNDKFVKYEK